MADGPLTGDDARRLFVAESMESREGPAPDGAEQLAAISAEFDAERARVRKARNRKVKARERRCA